MFNSVQKCLYVTEKRGFVVFFHFLVLAPGNTRNALLITFENSYISLIRISLIKKALKFFNFFPLDQDF